MDEMDEWEKLAKEFIIDFEPLTPRQKELMKTRKKVTKMLFESYNRTDKIKKILSGIERELLKEVNNAET